MKLAEYNQFLLFFKRNFPILCIFILTLAFSVCGDASKAPFEVYNVEMLKKVGTETTRDGWTLSAHYKLTANVNMSGKEFTAIGTKSAPFTGSFDGNGKKIIGLTINNPSGNYQGMFGCIRGKKAVVKNLGLENVNITGKEYAGGVAGDISSGSVIKNCYVTGDVKGEKYIGGVAGNNHKGTIDNCYTAGSVKSSSPYGANAGGVVGANNRGTVKNCYTTGSVKGSSDNTGGVAGWNKGTIKNCYVTGDVEGGWTVGGIVGENNFHSSIIKNCYVTGDVKGGWNVGGVAGWNEGTIKNCYVTGSVKSSEGYAGGVAGKTVTGSTIRNCVALSKNVTTAISRSNIGRVTGANIGRVAGTNNGRLFSNYARRDMTMINASGRVLSITSDRKGLHGADIVRGRTATDSSWWTSVTWSKRAPWDFNTIWNPAHGDRLPTLKGAGGRQNPTVP